MLLRPGSGKNQYCRPEVNLSGKILLKESRHPVVELLSDASPFVPNDALLDQDENRVLVITGPNMAGKSTYMRQIALIALMASWAALCRRLRRRSAWWIRFSPG